MSTELCEPVQLAFVLPRKSSYEDFDLNPVESSKTCRDWTQAMSKYLDVDFYIYFRVGAKLGSSECLYDIWESVDDGELDVTVDDAGIPFIEYEKDLKSISGGAVMRNLISTAL